MEEKKKVKKPRGIARLIPGKCIACGARCQESCKKDAVEMNDQGEPVIIAEKCIGCGRCVKVCPAEALEMYLTPEERKLLEELSKQEPDADEAEEEEVDEEQARIAAKLKEYKGVWVYVEQTDGKAATVSWELLGVGAELAKTLGVDLCTAVIGDNVEHLCRESFAHGASKAYLMDDPVFQHYRTESYYKAICHLVHKYKPEIILLGATGLGRDLAGAVATDLQTGLTADCTGLSIDERGFLLQTRPAFGGNIMATIMTERTRPQMSTVRPHVMPMPQRDDSLSGEVIREPAMIREEDIAVKVLEVIDDCSQGADAGRAGRGGRLFTRRGGGRVDAGGAPGGTDRQNGAAQDLYRLRDQRRHSAPGRHAGLGLYHRHQPGQGCPYIRGGHLRHRGRRIQRGAGHNQTHQGTERQ